MRKMNCDFLMRSMKPPSGLVLAIIPIHLKGVSSYHGVGLVDVLSLAGTHVAGCELENT